MNNLIDNLRAALFNLIGSKKTDKLRYLKLVSKLKKYSRPTNRAHFSREFANFYEPQMEIIPKIIPEDTKTFIDVGANYGLFSFFFSKLGYKNAKIYAFEPTKRSFRILISILRKFNLSNVIPIRRALGSEEETREIFMPRQYTTLAHIVDKKSNFNGQLLEQIKLVTFDSFVEKAKLDRIDLIKCDVEGFEFEVFKGAKKSLKKFKPAVFVEVEARHTKKYGVNENEMIKFFSKLDYECYGIDGLKLFKAKTILEETPLYFFLPKNFFKKNKDKKYLLRAQ